MAKGEKALVQEKLAKEEAAYQESLVNDQPSQQPVFIIEEADLKELNDYIQVVTASKANGILNAETALEGVIGRLQKYVKRQ